MADRVGQQLGNYRLVRLLGQGGFAEVYLGEHVYIGTQAAIKVLATQLAGQDIEQFRVEATTLAHLEHPHIVRVLDFGVEGTTPYLVMSYAPGGTLRIRHPKGSRLELSTVVFYVKQVASALQYAHEQKLIHRDVKPENLLLGRQQEVLLSDFGIALVAQTSRNQLTLPATGTVAYMAPEQIQGKPRPQSDQYSLGIIVYEWLTGSLPFTGSAFELFGQHLHVPPSPLREKVPGIPSGVEQVVLIALAKDPHQRFATVQAFATALEQASQMETAETISSASGTVLLTYSGHMAFVESIAWSPDGTRIASGSNDVQVWDASIGKNIVTYHGHSDWVNKRAWVNAVAWSPDSTRIASGGVRDNTVQVWDAATGKNLLTYNMSSAHNVSAVAWSPDGTRIAASGGDLYAVQVWDTSTGATLLTYSGHSGGDIIELPWATVPISWSPDGGRIASVGNDETVRVWDATTGKPLLTYPGHSEGMLAVAWSPDGSRIASAGADKTVQVWDAVSGTVLLTYRGHPTGATAVAWSPDGKRIASASGSRSSSDEDHIVQVWEAATGKTIYTYQGHGFKVNSVAWSPDGTRLASAGFGVQVWQAP